MHVNLLTGRLVRVIIAGLVNWVGGRVSSLSLCGSVYALTECRLLHVAVGQGFEQRYPYAPGKGVHDARWRSRPASVIQLVGHTREQLPHPGKALLCV